MIDADWTFVLPDGRRETRHVFTRMLMPHEIVAMFRRAGFDEIELLGSTEGEPFALDSIRCIVRGTRR